MFSIGGFELIVIIILALVIIKPADLPVIAEKTGKMVKKIRNTINSIKRDIDG